MKKQLTALSLAAAACMPAFAQNPVFNNPDNEAYFGIRVAGEVTCPGDFKVGNMGLGMFSNGGGIEFGAVYNVPVVANFYVEPGLKFFYNSTPVDKDLLKTIESEVPVESMSMRRFGLRVPVMLGYHFDLTDDFKVSVFTGPELEVGLSGKEHMKVYGESTSESMYGDEGGFRRADLLWDFGAGVSYQQFYFGVSGGIGMLNMADLGDNLKWRENRVSFTLGYNF